MDELKVGAMKTERFELALFPLNTVLFPGRPLPLHIFEPRYLTMIQTCLDRDEAFGVVLIREGQEVGGPAVPHEVGTTARVERAESLPCGRMSIVVLGQERFRLHTSMDWLQPYLVGQASLWPWRERPTPPPTLEQAVRGRMRQYLGLVMQIGQLSLDVGPMPAGLKPLAWWAASVVRAPAQEKQRVLETSSTTDLLRTVHRLLRQEIHVVQMMLAAERAVDMPVGPFSQN